MIRFSYYQSPVGLAKIGCRDDSLVYLKIVDKQDTPNNPDSLSDKIYIQLAEYLKGERREFNLKLNMQGTDFQKKVWNALLTVPYGETRSYKDIATLVGNPKACRAVGMANRNNPIWIVVPCHRIIGENKTLTGYEGGIGMKQYLLELEKRNK